MSIARVAGLLQQTIGLDATSIGTSAIQRAVRTRLGVCKLADPVVYWDFVSTSSAELQKLVEEVIVPETWFFRDREAFAALTQLAVQEWLQTPTSAPRRLLSVPCSTGEEPYSMAMALLDAGLAAERFRIDAIDVSNRVLDCAREAQYGRNSFRGVDFAFRDRYFQPIADDYRLSATVRRQVEFRQGNLFSGDAMPGAPVYDAVFCRNLLIYFDPAGQDRAVRALRQLLAPGANLFVGPSESALLLKHGFEWLKIPLAFAFRERRENKPASRIVAAASSQPVPAPAPAVVSRARRARSRVRSSGDSTATALAPDTDLEIAATLANQGRLVEAADTCGRYLRMHADSVAALHLMGLIHAAMDDLPTATQFYRRALYLDPIHLDTLLHLGLALEKQGDDAGARLLRERMLRATPGEGS